MGILGQIQSHDLRPKEFCSFCNSDSGLIFVHGSELHSTAFNHILLSMWTLNTAQQVLGLAVHTTAHLTLYTTAHFTTYHKVKHHTLYNSSLYCKTSVYPKGQTGSEHVWGKPSVSKPRACTALYSTVLYCTALHCTALVGTALHYSTLH